MNSDQPNRMPTLFASTAHRPTPSCPTAARPDSLLPIMWRHRWIVAGCVGAALAVALLYLVCATPLYTSTSRVYVERTGPQIIHETQPGVMTTSPNYLYTQAELMKSTPVVSAALERCGAKGLKALAHEDNPVAFLQKRLDVSVGRKDDIIRVSFKSPFAAESVQVVNAVVEAYVAIDATRKRGTSAEVLKILQREKTTRDQVLADMVQELAQFRKDHPALAFETGLGNSMLERFDRLSAALTEAQLATVEAKSYYDAAEQIKDDPAGLLAFVETYAAKTQAVAPRPETANLQARLRDLQASRSERLKLVLVEHPTVRALDAEIDQTQRQIAASEQQWVASHMAILKQQYLTAKEKEQQLVARFEEQREQITGLKEAAAHYAILESRYEQTKKLCDILEDRIREVNVTEEAGALNITVMEDARPALIPSEPHTARVLALALVLGLVLGGSAALIRQAGDHRLQTVGEVTTWLGFPPLGEVPAMLGRKAPTEYGRVIALEPSSAEAEAFRSIHTALSFSLPPEQSRVIQVTSAMPGEGKSILVSNLGIAMAQSGHRVLIVDADLRQPVQHVTFGFDGEKGLASVLAGTQQLSTAVATTSVPGLQVLPAGHGDGNPAELLGHRLFGALLARLAQHYDRVLVDSPPIGCMADARIIAAHCQATILVVRPGVCTYEALRCARESLIHVGDRLVGSVINGTGRGTKGSYSYAPWMGGPRRREDGGARGCPGISLLSAGPAVASLAERSEQCARAKTPADGVRVQAGRPVAGPGSEARRVQKLIRA